MTLLPGDTRVVVIPRGEPTERSQEQPQIEEYTGPAGGNFDPEGSPATFSEGLLQLCSLIAVKAKAD